MTCGEFEKKIHGKLKLKDFKSVAAAIRNHADSCKPCDKKLRAAILAIVFR